MPRRLSAKASSTRPSRATCSRSRTYRHASGKAHILGSGPRSLSRLPLCRQRFRSTSRHATASGVAAPSGPSKRSCRALLSLAQGSSASGSGDVCSRPAQPQRSSVSEGRSVGWKSRLLSRSPSRLLRHQSRLRSPGRTGCRAGRWRGFAPPGSSAQGSSTGRCLRISRTPGVEPRSHGCGHRRLSRRSSSLSSQRRSRIRGEEGRNHGSPPRPLLRPPPSPPVS